MVSMQDLLSPDILKKGKGSASNYGSTVDYIVPVNTTSVAAAVVSALTAKGETDLEKAFKSLPENMDKELEAVYPTEYFKTQDSVDLYISDSGGSIDGAWAWSTSHNGYSFYVLCQNGGLYGSASGTYTFSHWTESVSYGGRNYTRHNFSRGSTTLPYGYNVIDTWGAEEAVATLNRRIDEYQSRRQAYPSDFEDERDEQIACPLLQGYA